MTTLLYEREHTWVASATLDVAVRKLIALAKERTSPTRSSVTASRASGWSF